MSVCNLVIVRQLLRTGHYYIPNLSFTLGQFEEVCDGMEFPCKMEQNYFREDDWVITCPEILADRHNCFWAGQDCGNGLPIENPTKHMDTWQHANNPTWRT
jgi:hypothetical protein